MSHEGHQRHFAGGLVTSALPSTSDALLSRNKRRLGPILLKNLPVETVKAH